VSQQAKADAARMKIISGRQDRDFKRTSTRMEALLWRTAIEFLKEARRHPRHGKVDHK
jgi:hypothetical protein